MMRFKAVNQYARLKSKPLDLEREVVERAARRIAQRMEEQILDHVMGREPIQDAVVISSRPNNV